MGLRLGFHYHVPMYRNAANQLKTLGALGCFLDSLAPHYDKLFCFQHSPRPDEIPYMDYTIQSNNIHWVDIGSHASTMQRTIFNRRYTEPLREMRENLDVVLLRGPSPLLPAMAYAAGSTSVALLLVGDYVAGVQDLPQPRWRKEAIRLWSRLNAEQQLRVARHSLTFVNSHKLFEKLQPDVPLLYETRTTTLTRDDFYERKDTCLNRPFHLLYTGRMDRAKGLLQMVEAVQLLAIQGEDVILDLVGWPQKGDNILDELFQYARSRNIEDRIIYHGFKTVGSELFEYYRKADIYIIASLSSEGFPRTIWEAMAQSLPVIATNVGSIPYYLEEDRCALLIEPKNSAALARAVSRLIHNSEQRQELIRNGLRLATQNTLERRASELATAINEWVQDER